MKHLSKRFVFLLFICACACACACVCIDTSFHYNSLTRSLFFMWNEITDISLWHQWWIYIFFLTIITFVKSLSLSGPFETGLKFDSYRHMNFPHFDIIHKFYNAFSKTKFKQTLFPSYFSTVSRRKTRPRKIGAWSARGQTFFLYIRP